MEAPQGVELTGTNRPSDLNTPTPLGWWVMTAAVRVHYAVPGTRPGTQVPPGPTCSVERFGGHSGGETPGPIPNPEVKPSSADGTAPETVWESRTPPDINKQEGPPDLGRPFL